MTVTADAILQTIEIAVLIGIFARLGSFGEAIQNLKDRVTKLEDIKC